MRRNAVSAPLILVLALTSAMLPAATAAAGEAVSVWLTTANLSSRLAAQSSVSFAPDSGSNPLTIDVNEGRTFQQMFGFGATFTDSSAWLVWTKMNSTQRQALLNDLFTTAGTNGIGLNFLRQPMGATDFIKDVGGYYSYDDLPPGQTDPNLTSFSIAHDTSYIIPTLAASLATNSAIKVKLTSWSAPAWMKSNGSLTNGGSLNAQWYGTYALYLAKAIKAYESAGIPIWATSAQNEPTITQTYPSMLWTSAQASTFVRDNFAPTLATNGLQTAILAGDDVCMGADWATDELADAGTNAEMAGSSFHGYCGDFPALTTMHNTYPYKSVYQTEIAPGCHSRTTIDFVIEAPRNWAETVTSWNIALDPGGGPYHTGATSPCTGLVTVNQSTGAVTYTRDFYELGHASKFVARGAYRIDSTPFGVNSVPNVAFKNPDGSKVLVVRNSDSINSKTFKVRWGSQAFSYTLAAGAIATFKWSGTTTGDPAGWGNSINGANGGNPYGGGLKTGSWTINSASSVNSTGLGSGWNSIYRGGDASLQSFTASVDAQQVQAGTTSAFPKYGLYGCYFNDANYVQAWIDPAGYYVTHAVVAGSDLGWINTNLAGGFVFTNYHNIKVTKSGNSFTFYLDSVQQQVRTAAIPNCQIGLVTEDDRANFQNLLVRDPLRWGNSINGANGGNPYGGGLKTGSWTINGASSVSGTALGSGWGSIYREYDNRTSFTASVDARQVQAGTTSAFPKYGLYGCYFNDANYVQAWIDPAGYYVTHAVVAGSDLGWINTNLAGGFVFTNYHNIKVTKSGNSFTFYLDSVQQQVRTAAIPNCQIGLVTEDDRANFRNIVVS